MCTQTTRCAQLEAKFIITRMLRGNYVSDIQGRFVKDNIDLMLLYHHLVQAGVHAGMGYCNIYKLEKKPLLIVLCKHTRIRVNI
jgi:hypothetical protein